MCGCGAWLGSDEQESEPQDVLEEAEPVFEVEKVYGTKGLSS